MTEIIRDRGLSGMNVAQERAELEESIAVALDAAKDLSVRRAAALKAAIKCRLVAL